MRNSVPPRFVGLFAPRKADDAECRRHLLVLAQVVKRGNQLARREIAARAKDDDGAGFQRLALRAHAVPDVSSTCLVSAMAQTMAQAADKFNAVARKSKIARPAADFFATFRARE